MVQKKEKVKNLEFEHKPERTNNKAKSTFTIFQL